MRDIHNNKKYNWLFQYFLLTSLDALISFSYLLFIRTDPKNQILLGFSLPRLVMLLGFLILLLISLCVCYYFSKHPQKAYEVHQNLKKKNSVVTIIFITSLLIFQLALVLLFIPYSRLGGSIEAYGERLKPLFLFFLILGIINLFIVHLWFRNNLLDRIAKDNPGSNKKIVHFFKFLLAISTTLFLLPNSRLGDLQITADYSYLYRPIAGFFILLCIQYFLYLIIYKKLIKWHNIKDHFVCNKSVLILSGIIFLTCLILFVIIACTSIGNKGPGLIFSKPGLPLLGIQVWILGWALYYLSFFYDYFKFKFKSRKLWNNHKDKIIASLIFIITAVIWLSTPAKSTLFETQPFPPNNVPYPHSDAALWDIFGHSSLIGEGFAFGNIFEDHLGYSAFLAVLNFLTNNDYRSVINLQVVTFSFFPVIIYFIGKSLYNRKTGLFVAGLVVIHSTNMILLRSHVSASNVKVLMTEYPTAIGLSLLTYLLITWLNHNPQKKMGYALPIGGVISILILIRFPTLLFLFSVFAILILAFRTNWKFWVRSSLIILLSLIIVLSPWIWRSWQYSGTPFFFLPKSSLLLDEDFRSSDDSTQLTMLPGGMLANHFTHNLITTVLLLPSSPIFYDLYSTVLDLDQFRAKFNLNSENTIVLSITETTVLFVNLAIISLGIAFSIKKWNIIGAIPLIILSTQWLASAIARTSGGRYIIPTIWAILLYYGLGFSMIFSLFNDSKPGDKNNPHILPYSSEIKGFSIERGVLYTLPFLIFVGLMTCMDRIIPQKYADISHDKVLDYITRTDFFEKSGTTYDALKHFIESPNTMIYFGMDLYPRFLLGGEGFSTSQYTFVKKDFPRLAFNIIGSTGLVHVYIPCTTSPDQFPNAADTLVIGCRSIADDYPIHTISARIAVQIGVETKLILSEPFSLNPCP